MEFISPNQLQNYEAILQEINREFEKSKKLKMEIEKTDDRIVALKLSAHSCKQKICHVNVKIFDNISEIYNLYDSDIRHCDLQTLRKLENCNYFLIEVFLPNYLVSKLLASKWKLQFTVFHDGFYSCKVVALIDKTYILEIIPISTGIRECSIETCLFLCSDDNWNIIDLQRVDVDISYYFKSVKDKSWFQDISDDLLNVTNLYKIEKNCSNIKLMQPPIHLQTQILFNADNSKLIANLIKHSYHRLDLELFADFSNDTKNVVDVQFCVDNKKIKMLYNKSSKALKIRCCSSEMLLVKNFFVKLSICDYREVKHKLKEILKKKNSVYTMDQNEIVTFYYTLRKIWS